MQKFVCCCVLLIVFSPSAWSISNIESQRPGLPGEGIHGAVKLGVSGKTGNQKEEDYQLALKGTWRLDRNIFLAIGERNYGSNQSIKDTDDGFVHARWTHLVTEKWGLESFVQWENNDFNRLTSRTLAGAGGRYILASEKDVYSLAAGLGLFREREKYDLQTFSEVNRYWRVNTFFTYKHQLNPQVFLASTAYLQPDASDIKNLRVLCTFGLTVKLTSSLNLQLDYKIVHNSDPAQNLSANPPIDSFKTNTEYSTAFVYNF